MSKSKKKEVSIFRTSVNCICEVKTLQPLLNNLVGSGYWNFDFEDYENILRVYSFSIMNNFLTKEINKMGFECEEIY